MPLPFETFLVIITTMGDNLKTTMNLKDKVVYKTNEAEKFQKL
jgi:hypothetical protein